MVPPSLRLVAKNPAVAAPNITTPELCSSLAKTWDRWHPIDPPPDHDPWISAEDIDWKVHEVVWRALEQLWDETAELGVDTGEVVSFAMFPSPIVGYQRPRLRLIE